MLKWPSSGWGERSVKVEGFLMRRRFFLAKDAGVWEKRAIFALEKCVCHVGKAPFVLRSSAVSSSFCGPIHALAHRGGIAPDAHPLEG